MNAYYSDIHLQIILIIKTVGLFIKDQEFSVKDQIEICSITSSKPLGLQLLMHEKHQQTYRANVNKRHAMN